MKRRSFIKTIGAGISAMHISDLASFSQTTATVNKIKPLVIASENGLKATAKAMEMIRNNSDALDAVIAGVNLVEDDPSEHSVGYGGLPNEEGVVELDACCMHGPTHKAGAVAALRNIKNPSKVAQLVLERTDHVLLVGEGALRFARSHGFKEENLLTDEAREIWLYWKETMSEKDSWFPPKPKDMPEHLKKYFNITGTITCMGIDLPGNISGVTTTSGLAFKIPGRVGDSPVIGAGLYVDNEVGACGSTGRGEENLKNLSCFLAVEFMRQGMKPQEACMAVIKRVISHAKLPSLVNDKGLPSFQLSFYAFNKAGETGGAAIYGPSRYAVHNGIENKLLDMAYMYQW